MNYFPHIKEVLFLDSIHLKQDFKDFCFPEDFEYSDDFSESRKEEFLTGRTLVYALMNKLNLEKERINIGDRNEPIFPSGINASISHSKGFIIACATNLNYEIGIDIEHKNRIKPDLYHKLFNSNETQLMKAHSLAPETLFSAKEAFYKMQYPTTKTYLDFLDVELSLISKNEFAIKYLNQEVVKLQEIKIYFEDLRDKVLSFAICPSLEN